MAALQTSRLSLSHEDKPQEDEEELEKLVELLLLEVYSPLLFQGLLKVKLNYGV